MALFDGSQLSRPAPPAPQPETVKRTVAYLQPQRRAVTFTCYPCKHVGRLDLDALLRAGRGDLDLDDALDAKVFRCGDCGSADVMMDVAP